VVEFWNQHGLPFTGLTGIRTPAAVDGIWPGSIWFMNVGDDAANTQPVSWLRCPPPTDGRSECERHVIGRTLKHFNVSVLSTDLHVFVVSVECRCVRCHFTFHLNERLATRMTLNKHVD
jgi:hypothetical protein